MDYGELHGTGCAFVGGVGFCCDGWANCLWKAPVVQCILYVPVCCVGSVETDAAAICGGHLFLVVTMRMVDHDE